MVTALVFQLIQCVVQLPSERDSEEEHKKKVVACLTTLFLNFPGGPPMGSMKHSVCLSDYHNTGAILNVPNCISRWTKMSSSWTPMRLPWGRRRIFCLSSSRSKWLSDVRSAVKPIQLCLQLLFHAVVCPRCGSKQGEEDYRPLFENFVHDLLSSVNRPEWPVAELLLSLLGRLLVGGIGSFHD